jgi:hypothetical protein
MITYRFFSLLAALCLLPIGLGAAEEPAPKSGLEVGNDLPGPFHPFNVTGKEAGNFHCVLCDNGLDPLVLVFVRNSEFGDKLQEFLKTLEAAVAKDPKAHISVAAIFLFDDLKNVVTDDVNRKKYAEKIEALKAPNKLEHIVLGLDSADGPKGYGLKPDMKATVLVCSKLQVAAKFAYPDETKIDTKAILTAVNEKVGSGAKR